LIYLDTSVVLARLFAEDRSPPDVFWSQTFVASRLLEYEVFNRIHARAAQASHGAAARQLVDRANLLEMTAEVLGRALLPFAQPLRTLDALHLATLVFLRSRGLSPGLATYDQRLAAAAISEGFVLADC
jgi:predicted nucleic acid-binding protein